ncbi:MAG TPA: GNAT family N-acetyltransferase [Candidatus Latescibacteria bacterium]|nr:GNAT family N-acetyltransferase [Candidatus Latescibacterota bacterium]
MTERGRLLRPLRPDEFQKLADAIDETPETVIPIHLLRRGTCRVYSDGEPSPLVAVVVQSESLRGEALRRFGLGSDSLGLWDLLRRIDDWERVDVSPTVAPRLGALIRESTGERVCYYDDVYHILRRPAPVLSDPAVRELTLDDLGLLDAAGVEGDSFGDLSVLLTEGVVAAAVISGKIVATAQTGALTERYADIGVQTDAEWRRRGFATVMASIVARRVQKAGRIPVWSCGEDNMASLRVAEKLGFQEVSRLTYVIKGS